MCLTQDGKGVLKTAFVMEIVSVDGHKTRLGMSFSQSCEGGCDVEVEGEGEGGRLTTNPVACRTIANLNSKGNRERLITMQMETLHTGNVSALVDSAGLPSATHSPSASLLPETTTWSPKFVSLTATDNWRDILIFSHGRGLRCKSHADADLEMLLLDSD